MKYYFKIFILITLIAIPELSCSKSTNTGQELPTEGIFRVWALADIQPKNKSHRDSFSRAVLDINNNVPEIKFSIVAGDIVNRTEVETFDWYINERDKSYVGTWYEIIGNHDLKSDKGKLFREKLREEVHYKVEYGNMLFIFLSDEISGKPTEIEDETFEWWKNTVINNQDKIIVVVTHAPLEGSKIPFSTQHDRKILESERFTDVLKDYKIDLWLSGHLHLPHEFTNTLNINPDLNDTAFVHISSIRPEFLGLKNSQSRILDFYCDDNKLIVRSRDHDTPEWNEELTQEITLSKTVVCQ